jgi:hypothetical protein
MYVHTILIPFCHLPTTILDPILTDMTAWTIEAYCEAQQPCDLLSLSSSTRAFISSLNLPTIHPFCAENAPRPYAIPGIPEQGPLINHDYLESVWDIAVTLIAMSAPAVLAMAELWLRLFASLLAPLGIALLIRDDLSRHNNAHTTWFLSVACLLTVASSVVLLTDTLYVLEFGPSYGASLLVLSTTLALRTCTRHGLVGTSVGVIFLLLWTVLLSIDSESPGITLSFGGKPDDMATIPEGLYYDASNPHISAMVDRWPVSDRTYTPETGATRWMTTGDARTGLSFLLHRVVEQQPTSWTRVWLPLSDGEVVALDMRFPETGHDAQKPVYMILHGLNGGSHEPYVRDFSLRRTQEGSTVIVMIARGLMDLPVRGWDMFHGGRWLDAHEAAQAVRKGLGNHQVLAGVGYSMG